MDIRYNRSYFYEPTDRGRKLYFYPVCIGRGLFPQGFVTSRRSFESYLVMYLEEGSLYLQDGKKEIPVEPGQAALVDCFRPHTYGAHGLCRMQWLHFDGPLARAYFEECTVNGPVVRPRDPQNCLFQLCRIFDDFNGSRMMGEEDLSCRIVRLLTEVIAAAGQKGRPRRPDAIEAALALITENLAEPLSLEKIAEHVSLSPSYLCRLFRQEVGMPPHEYLLQLRVDQARSLLRSTSMPLREIAYACGFRNECSFSTTFRKLSGFTPLSYRNSNII